MKLFAQDDSELMEIHSLEPDHDKLLIKGKVFGSMPIAAKLTPAEARKALKLLNFRLAIFLLTFLFRK
jgi:hypothetical protein